MFDILFQEYNDSHKAYDHLLEFLVADNYPPIIDDIESGVEWFFVNDDFADNILKTYKPYAIKSDKYDHLGDIYIENVIGQKEAGRKGLYLTPQHLVDMMCQMTIGRTDEQVNILDPCVGTGRFLMTANTYAPNAALFGVDNNLTMIRTAFTNSAIYQIPVYLLYADFLVHETDMSTPDGLYNWRFANRWQPQIDKLRPRRPGNYSRGDAKWLRYKSLTVLKR